VGMQGGHDAHVNHENMPAAGHHEEHSGAH